MVTSPRKESVVEEDLDVEGDYRVPCNCVGGERESQSKGEFEFSHSFIHSPLSAIIREPLMIMSSILSSHHFREIYPETRHE